MPLWLWAAAWGLLGGSALLLGALIGFYGNAPQRFIGATMAFGAGVLISALAFELLEESTRRGGITATAIGFLGGAVVYTAANFALSRFGAKHRKRSEGQQPSEEQSPGSGTAIALGALLDGVPESIAIGVSLIKGGAVSWVTVAAVFLSNVPEGLSSAAGMKRAHRSAGYVLGLWAGIAVLSGLAALCGEALFRGFSPGVISSTVASAAGAILAMLADTMMPEAFEHTHDWAGLITVAGFFAAYLLSSLGP